MSKKLIVILGPTASGKSEIAVRLAKKFNGEIISADSRQVYKEMDIGTGKVKNQKSKLQLKSKNYFYKGIEHYLLNVASPKKRFTVTQYQKLALKAIEKIFRKGKLPILCGGTGFYIQAVVDGIIMPEVKPDWKLREKLEKKSEEELFNKLKNLDSQRAKTIDRKNKRRLIRAIEIIIKTKKPVPLTSTKPPSYPILLLGIKLPKKELEKKIKKRVNEMFEKGLEKEVKSLVKKYGWVPALQTIGYQEWKETLEQGQSPLSKNCPRSEKVKNLIILHTKQFAKRQMTWFKKDKRIFWIKNQRQVEKLVKKFL